MRSTTEDMLLWEDRIKERTRSGMTIEEWCKKNESTKHKYNYWNHRINKKHEPNKEMIFAEITPTISKTQDAASNLDKADAF